jgi:HrpA-like RNA helicase
MWHPGSALSEDPSGGSIAPPAGAPAHRAHAAALPIFRHRAALLHALETCGALILCAETGAGKSTQLPQYLHAAGWTSGGRVIAVTQPRRVAAASLAARVAEELGVQLGREVGYSVRFDACCGDATRILYTTEDALLREMSLDPLLSRYSVVMVDEAHERSLAVDVLLGLLLHVRHARPELRVIVASATLEAERLLAFFSQQLFMPVAPPGAAAAAAGGAGAPSAGKRAAALEEEEEEGGEEELRRALSAALAAKRGGGGGARAAAAAASALAAAELPDAPCAVLVSGEVVSDDEGGGAAAAAAAGGPPPVDIEILQRAPQKKSRWGAAAAPGAAPAGGGAPPPLHRPPPPPTGGVLPPLPPPPSGAAPPAAAAAAAPLLPARIVALPPGDTLPVDVQHSEAPVADFVAAAADAAVSLLREGGRGDVLVFLPGAPEISACEEAFLEAWRARCGCDAPPPPVLPLHEGLSWAAQRAALAAPPPHAPRRVVLASAIAECAVTVPGVGAVVDSGWSRFTVCDPISGVSSEVLAPASRSSCAQRAGRAGRAAGGGGKCVRLFTEAAARCAPAVGAPEAARADPSPAVLRLLALGVANVARFPYMDPPRPEALARSLEYLYAAGAVDARGALTAGRGRALAALPTPPAAGLLLLAGARLGCAEDALTLAACMGVEGGCAASGAAAGEAFAAAFGAREGDHVALLNAYAGYEGAGRSSAWAAARGLRPAAMAAAAAERAALRAALAALVSAREAAAPAAGGAVEEERYSLDASAEAVEDGAAAALPRRALAAALFANAARLDGDGAYVTLRGGAVGVLHTGSVLARVAPPPPYVVFEAAVWEGGALRLKGVSAVAARWIQQAAPDLYAVAGGHAAVVARAEAEAAGGGGGARAPPPALRYKSAAERRREEQAEAATRAAGAAGAAAAVAAAVAAAGAPRGPGAVGAQLGGGGESVAATLGKFFEAAAAVRF